MTPGNTITSNGNEHASHQFNAELEAIRASVLVMAGMVKDQVRDAIESLTSGNIASMTRTLDDNPRINAIIDQVCNEVLARRKPNANDLRFVMTVIKTISDLEHIGNEAEKIASMAQMLPLRYGLSIPRYNEYSRVSEIVSDMLCKSLDSFARMDVLLAAEVMRKSDLLDDEFHAIMRNLIMLMMEDPHMISGALEMQLLAKAIERIGDHARNISRYVIYMGKGSDLPNMTVEKTECKVLSAPCALPIDAPYLPGTICHATTTHPRGS